MALTFSSRSRRSLGLIMGAFPLFLIASPYVAWSSGAPEANLLLELRAEPNPSEEDQPISLLASVQNQGPQPAQQTQLILQFPKGTELRDAGGDGWACIVQVGDTTVVCQREQIASSITSVVEVRFVPPLTYESFMVTGTVDASKATTDSVTRNNRAQVEIRIQNPAHVRSTGGGMSCSVTSTPPPLGSTGLLALFLFCSIGAAYYRARRKNCEF